MRVRSALAVLAIGAALFPAASSGAAQTPGTCAVTFVENENFDGSTGSTLDGILTCQAGVTRFIGLSPTRPNLCAGGTPLSVSYSADGTTWTLTGASGTYALVVTDANGQQWRGVVTTAADDICGAADATGSGEAVQADGNDQAAPAGYQCHASGSVDFAWSSGETGRLGSGSTSGSGSCRDAGGVWSMTYIGSWVLTDSGFQTRPCPADTYDVVLTLQRDGQTRSLTQQWSTAARPLSQFDSTTPDSGVAMTVIGPQGLPLGGGTLSKSMSPCALPSGGQFSTTESWAFADD